MACTVHVAWDERLTDYHFGPDHPMAPVRVELADPLILQGRPVIEGAQLGQGDVSPHLHRLARPLGEQAGRDQAAHRVFKRIVVPLLPAPGVLRPIGADSAATTWPF